MTDVGTTGQAHWLQRVVSAKVQMAARGAEHTAMPMLRSRLPLLWAAYRYVDI